MTRVPRLGLARVGAILSRLLIVLTFVLFGVPQSEAEGTANAGPFVDNNAEQAQGIRSDPRPLLRSQLPDDHSADIVVTGVAFEVWHRSHVAIIPTAPHSLRLCGALPILPPVRGPPVA